MGPKRSTLEKALKVELASAARARAVGDHSAAADAGTLAVMNVLEIAVKHYEVDEGIQFLVESRLSEWIDTTYTDYVELFAGIVRGEHDPGEVGGNYLLIVLAQSSWLIGNEERGGELLRMANHPCLFDLSTPFWREYGRGLQELDCQILYEPRAVRIQGIELHWQPQLRLMSAISKGSEALEVMSECEHAFARQNKDRSLDPDSYGIEGNGKEPVRWSFRLESFRRRWLS